MKVKSSYNQIPSTWQMRPIGNFVKSYTGGAPLKPDDFSSNGFQVIPKKAVVSGGKLTIPDDKQTYCHLEFASQYKKSVVDRRYLITTLRDLVPSGPFIGYIVEIQNNDQYILSQGVYGFILKEGLHPGYLIQLSNTSMYRRTMQRVMVGSTQVHIRTGEYFDIKIPVPPVEEQQKIAEILSAWDEAIRLTQELITAKEQRKKGLMQRLLTGQVRFSEFEKRPWQTVHMSDIFARVTRKNDVGNENVLTASAHYGLVSQTDFFNKRVAGKDLSGYYLLKRGEFAYNRSSSAGYDYGAIKRLDDYDTGVLSTLYICFRLKDRTQNSDFLTHYFEFGGLDKEIYGIAQEGARSHGLLNVTLADFFNLQLTLPSREEQARIAEVLNACDQEIQLLQQKLAALQHQKKGLMQRLLTGQVRVPLTPAEPLPTLTPIQLWALLLSAHYHPRKHSHPTRVEMQKQFYLLQETVGEPLDLSFSEWTYGPYSDDLHQQLTEMNGHIISGYGDGQERSEIKPQPDALKAAQALLAQQPAAQEQLDRLQRLLTGFEAPRRLEELATVHWVMVRNPGASLNEVIEQVHQWSERKSKFKPERLRQAWQRLREFTA